MFQRRRLHPTRCVTLPRSRSSFASW
uniref:Uncharacterized protein n=1 Tax=Arundo donax TaxID=35708 RepID=A0A0A9ACI0_ARUDO